MKIALLAIGSLLALVGLHWVGQVMTSRAEPRPA